MGLRLAALAVALAATPAGFLQAHQTPSGAFAEAGGSQGPLLTAWAALGLRAAGADTGKALDYLRAHEAGLAETTDVELVALAESALCARPAKLIARIRSDRRPDGRIGPNVNSTIWGILALRQARQPAPPAAVRFVLRKQARSGGWAWYLNGRPDSNDTAAAIEQGKLVAPGRLVVAGRKLSCGATATLLRDFEGFAVSSTVIMLNMQAQQTGAR